MKIDMDYHSELLKKALEKVEKPIELTDLDKLSVKALRDKLHEANVYEIELQIQNQELIEAQQRLIDAVSEQKKLSSEYQSLFNDAPIAYVILDSRGLIVSANTRFCEMVNIKDLGMITNRPLDKFIAPTEKNILHSHIKCNFI